MEYVHPEIHLQRRTSRFARLNNLLVDMVDYTRMNPLANLMLIMKYTPEDEDIELVRIVNEVKKRNYNVFLVVGDNQDRDNCGYPSDVLPGCTIWTWTSLVSGGPSCTSDEEDDEEDDGEDVTMFF
ncbi:unnamed protein product [Arabis nemorensis]|uniref:NYN domain-containing protein n=1 Tax=Arabis nemorensis TaxID=586526 RepID=A0A565BF80_9BRAS|nr:unnamed protein product [Arabis nemorensis]